MKRLLILAGVIVAAFLGANLSGPFHSDAPTLDRGGTALSEAFSNRISDAQVTGTGIVMKVLPDDNEGSRHQRFVLQLDSGQTLLIAHNIDVAPRVESLDEGDTVAFHGEYEWNAQGGVVHWTHHDPDGSHPAGWLKHEGHTYR